MTIATTTDWRQELVAHCADYLLINAGFINDPGLWTGKLGIASALLAYSEMNGSTIYNDFAADLLEDMYMQVDRQTGIGYANGLAGIVAGLSYLQRADYISLDLTESMMEAEAAITAAIEYPDLSSLTDVAGMLYYLHRRYQDEINAGRTLVAAGFQAQLQRLQERIATLSLAEATNEERLLLSHITGIPTTAKLQLKEEQYVYRFYLLHKAGQNTGQLADQLRAGEKWKTLLKANAMGLKDGVAGLLLMMLADQNKKALDMYQQLCWFDI
jgi:hypothetical protein